MPTALIVEDEPEANRLLSLLVQLRGYRTESAFTGGEALSIVDDRPPDVVFLDLMLPDVNGYDVCRALKSRRRTNAIAVVMVTARLADENRVQSFRAGANDFIPKPYTPEQIYQALSEADTWRRGLERHADHGEITFRARDVLGPINGIQRLTSLLLARTPLSEETIRRIGQALLGLGHEAAEWGRRHRVDDVAAIRYELKGDRVRLTIRDVGGWFGAGRPARERLATILSQARFDEVDEEPGGEVVHLAKRFVESNGSGR